MAEPDEDPVPWWPAQVTSGGQISLPQEARDDLDIALGSRVLVFLERQNQRLIVIAPPPGEDLLALSTEKATSRPTRRSSHSAL